MPKPHSHHIPPPSTLLRPTLSPRHGQRWKMHRNPFLRGSGSATQTTSSRSRKFFSCGRSRPRARRLQFLVRWSNTCELTCAARVPMERVNPIPLPRTSPYPFRCRCRRCSTRGIGYSINSFSLCGSLRTSPPLALASSLVLPSPAPHHYTPSHPILSRLPCTLSRHWDDTCGPYRDPPALSRHQPLQGEQV